MAPLFGFVSLGFALALIPGCAGEEEDDTMCCTVRTFCNNCTTCESEHYTIGESGDEAACQLIVEDWLDSGRYCHAVTMYEVGEMPTEEYLAQCSSD